MKKIRGLTKEPDNGITVITSPHPIGEGLNVLLSGEGGVRGVLSYQHEKIVIHPQSLTHSGNRIRKAHSSLAILVPHKGGKRAAFTLAEILITLAIIGVVAAMTLSTLITKINDKVSENQAAVFNAKFIKGLNLAKTAGDLNNTYSSTYDFLENGLSKHYKMAKICDSSHIRDCVPYDKIKYSKNGKEKSIKVYKIKSSSKNLNLTGSFFEDVAAFVSGDGIPVIISYNKECLVDTEKLDKSINSCVAGVYDINGSRKPNKFGTELDTDGKTVKSFTGDLRAFNGAVIGSACVGEIGDICVMSAAVGGRASAYNDIFKVIQTVDPSYVRPDDDNWQLAQDYCSKVVPGSRLPSKTELAKIATVWYDTLFNDEDGKNFFGSNDADNHAKQAFQDNKMTMYAALGIIDNPSYVFIWSNSDKGPDDAFFRMFTPTTTSLTYAGGRYYTPPRVVCVEAN